MKSEKVETLIGKTITEIVGMEEHSKCIRIVCSDGTRFEMLHYQDCCEIVEVNDVVGNPEDLIGSSVTMAEESTNHYDCSEDPENKSLDSHTWTFYKFATLKGYVTIRWIGESNGYYSESVTFSELEDGDSWWEANMEEVQDD